MLVLQMTPKEKITIGPHITLQFLGMRDGQAQLGISAPRTDQFDIAREKVALPSAPSARPGVVFSTRLASNAHRPQPPARHPEAPGDPR